MKKHTLVTLAISLMIASTLFTNIGDATNQTTYVIETNGTINNSSVEKNLTVLLRHWWPSEINSNNITSWVDSIVEKFNYGSDMYASIVMTPDGILFWGSQFNLNAGTWGPKLGEGLTYNQWKTLIDRFHYHQWKIGIDMPTRFGPGDILWEYVNGSHRELAFTNANGKKVGLGGSDGVGNKYNFAPNWNQKFDNDDDINNISKGTSLIDLFTERLTRMINDGISWDFIQFSDGWFYEKGLNGVSLYDSDYATWASFSIESIEEFKKNSNQFLDGQDIIWPEAWSIYSVPEKINWIFKNAQEHWSLYWQMINSRNFAQIKQSFTNAGKTNIFNTILVVDNDCSAHFDGRRNGMNVTWNARLNAIDGYYIDVESVWGAGSLPFPSGDVRSFAGLGSFSAAAAAMIKSKDPKAICITGLQLSFWTDAPQQLWTIKQTYLAQVENYVFFNGERYRTNQPDIIYLQYPDQSTYNQTAAKELFNWIKAILPEVGTWEPIWLGPTYILGEGYGASDSQRNWKGWNYTFSQWLDINNLMTQIDVEKINDKMGTIFLDERYISEGPWHKEIQTYGDRIRSLYSSGKLNIIFYAQDNDYDDLGRLLGNSSANEQIFKLKYNRGSQVSNCRILSNFTDVAGKSIISGYEGKEYVTRASGGGSSYGVQIGLEGFIPLCVFDDGRIQLGIIENEKIGRFTYVKNSIEANSNTLGELYPRIIPSHVMNKILYWTSKCPIISSEPLIDVKIFSKSEKIIIPMMNMKDMEANNQNGATITYNLNVNSDFLSLGNIADYEIYWLSNSSEKIYVSDWNSITLTLKGMADILIISRIS